MVDLPADTDLRQLRTLLLTAFLWYGVALLPFDFLPLRFEGHETHRAGLTLVIAVGVWAVLLLTALKSSHSSENWTPLEKLFTGSLILLALTYTLTALLALSPTLALVGDLVRRMGLLTQLALLSLVVVARFVDWRWLARGFWFAGVICGVYTLLQFVGWLPNPIDGRAFGSLGAPTFTASWLVGAMIWSSAWVLSDTAKQRWLRLVRVAGLVLMTAALVATGGRGALLGLVAGALVGAIAFAWVTRQRALLMLIGGLILCIGLGLVSLSRIDWQTSPLATWPLISRLNPTLPDTPRAVREQVWQNAVEIFAAPPLFAPFDGEPDRFHPLRRWFGYGQDHFELVHRPYVDDRLRAMEQGRPIDRAHNVILDLLTMHGALGVIVWFAVWMLGAVLALRRLAQARQSGKNCWLPVLILTIIAAHSVDLLFSFETLAGGWGAWLVLGLVLRDEKKDVEADFASIINSERWLLMTAVLAALLSGRGLSQLTMDGTIPYTALLMLIAVIALAAFAAQSLSTWRRLPVYMAVSATGIVSGLFLGRIQPADAVALIAIAVFGLSLCGLYLSAGWRIPILSMNRRSAALPISLVLLSTTAYWFSETRAQIHFSQGLLSQSTESQADLHRQAAQGFPFDWRLQMYAAVGLYQSAVNRIEGIDVVILIEARQLGEAAVKRNPYDADALQVLAEIERVLVTMNETPDNVLHLQRVLQLEQAASALLHPPDH